MIEHLEDEARDALESSRHGQRRASAGMDVAGKRIEVFARRLHDGSIRFGYGYCGTRLERKALLMLICPEDACPYHAATRDRWRAHVGEVMPVPRVSAPKLEARPLFDEVPVCAGERECMARPASFKCSTPCPLGAHAAIPMHKTGWDLFERGRCVAGGLTVSPATKALAPMLPTIEAARTWLSGQPSPEHDRSAGAY